MCNDDTNTFVPPGGDQRIPFARDGKEGSVIGYKKKAPERVPSSWDCWICEISRWKNGKNFKIAPHPRIQQWLEVLAQHGMEALDEPMNLKREIFALPTAVLRKLRICVTQLGTAKARKKTKKTAKKKQ